MVAPIAPMATLRKSRHFLLARAAVAWWAWPHLLLFFLATPYTAIAGGGKENRPAAEIAIPRTIPARPDSLQLLADGQYYTTLTELIQNAAQRIDMAMFLFKAPKDSLPAAIADELIKAEKRGVRVHVILENSGYEENINEANRQVAELLQKNRVKVTFDSPDRTAHAKIVVIDKRYCLLGSHNLTQAALKHNSEFSLLIDSRALARELLDYMEKIGPSAEDSGLRTKN